MAYYGVIWDTLYSTSSSRDKCTLYQIRTLIDRRNVVKDPKKDLHACQSFLTVVLEALILSTFHSVINVESLSTEMNALSTAAEKKDFIAQVAGQVVNFTNWCPTGSSNTPHDGDDVSSYTSRLLGMGLMAWDIEDAIREGDGARIIRLWKFLLVTFKQAGRTKYSIEALQLLWDVTIALTEKQSHELIWNRTCNTRGGAGHNKPLDLLLEHLNRDFKSSIGSFAPHVRESSVLKTSHASPVVNEFVNHFDKLTNVRQDSGYHPTPLQDKDRQDIIQLFMKNNACRHIPGRQYTHFKGISSHLYSEILLDNNWGKFNNWLESKIKELSWQDKYYKYRPQ